MALVLPVGALARRDHHDHLPGPDSTGRPRPASNVTWIGTAAAFWHDARRGLTSQTFWLQIQVFFLFFVNFLIFMGPLLLMGISQIRGYEPGDAEWGVKLDHVRGQAEAKEEIRRIVTLWQSGEVFEEAGGKRERGLLFLGAPGTGKTMMAKAIATGLQLAVRHDPGLRLRADLHRHRRDHRPLPRAQGEEARQQVGRPVHRLHRRDRRRRHAPPGARRRRDDGRMTARRLRRRQFYGPWGAVNPSGDLICENAAWREWMFRQRAPGAALAVPGLVHASSRDRQPGHVPGRWAAWAAGSRSTSCSSTMDGVDNPPFLRRVLTNKINSFLDAIYIVPRRVGKHWGRVVRRSSSRSSARSCSSIALDRASPAARRPSRTR